MQKVKVMGFSVSIDGYAAGPDQSLENPLGIGGLQVHEWAFKTRAFAEMQGREHDKARSLSGGQMRRIEIARALLHRPSLLLLDEATVGLDIQSRAGILATIRRLVDTEGIGVLWATHLIDEVDDGDHAVVLRQGNLVASGTVSDLIQASGTGSIRDAFSKLNRAETPGIAEISP